MTVAGQPTVNYTYDDANRLTQIDQGTTIVGFGYDNADRRTTLTLPNGISVEYGYDAASQLKALTYKLGTSVLGTLTYTYDAAGRRTEMSGSWARTLLPRAMSSATYDAANQLTSWAGATVTYDANGNLLNDGVRSYGWDARNRLAAVGGVAAGTSAYDGLGRRVTNRVNARAAEFLYDGFRPVQEWAGDAPKVNLLTGLRMDEVFRRTDAAGSRDVLTDALGSTIALSDQTGTLKTTYTYEPFGGSTAAGEKDENTFQFGGREHDGTGLVYYRARYVSPETHRFVSEDPLVFNDDGSRYVFVGNDPINYVDPSGLTRMIFDVGKGRLWIDPERKGSKPYDVSATSGKGRCMNNPTCGDKLNEGPIPPGEYYIQTKDLTDPSLIGDLMRNYRPDHPGDWGDWRVPILPSPGTKGPGRTGGFFLHGGSFPGSAGCIDIGGGIRGNGLTDRIKADILSDPDGKVPLIVR